MSEKINLTVWKYDIPIEDGFFLEMPKNCEVLSVQTQNNKPVLWVMVNPNAEKWMYHFRLFGTGHPIPECGSTKYIGTFQLENGALAFHLFQTIFMISETEK